MVGLVALVPAWWLSAPLRGYLTAEFDLLRGTYAVLGYGLPPSWDRNMRVCYASDMGFNTVPSPGAWSRGT
jgi:hypothetical protein